MTRDRSAAKTASQTVRQTAGRTLGAAILTGALVGLLDGCAGTMAPNDPGPSSVGVAKAALAGGSPQMALQAAEAILTKDPRNARALQVKGDALTATGRTGQAEWSYRAALSRDPDLVGAHIGLGRCLLAYDPAAAEAEFRAAIVRDAHNAAALNDLGVARDLQHRHDAAQQAYRQALVEDPDMIGAQANLALSLAMAGHAEDAERIMAPYGEDAGASRKMRHDYAAVLAMDGKTEQAARVLSADLNAAAAAQAISGFALARDGDAPP